MTDNELIAEFMGLERAKANHDFFFIAEYHAYVSPENILYHKSWDWLMPVVEKIESMGYPASITPLEYCPLEPGMHLLYFCKTEPRPLNIAEGIDKDKIRAWYKAVVMFIRWYKT